ncbi:MAG: hypothetical protein IAF38_01825 [Bacteroidia bacterium]|nr:hypothetical protein [Bacteroidia bacterium]
MIVIVNILIPVTGDGSNAQDGDAENLKSATERLCGKWRIDSYKKNGIDKTFLKKAYTEVYTPDGNYSYSCGNISGTGRWTFQNKEKEIKLIHISNPSPLIVVILKLEEKQFWYYYMEGNDKKEFHMVEQ